MTQYHHPEYQYVIPNSYLVYLKISYFFQQKYKISLCSQIPLTELTDFDSVTS
jgi:hypothetical protein